jgi:hypothetical protein
MNNAQNCDSYVYKFLDIITRNISSSGLEKLTAVGIRCAEDATPTYRQNLALTSPTSGGRSVGTVRSRTQATESSLFVLSLQYALAWD